MFGVRHDVELAVLLEKEDAGVAATDGFYLRNVYF